MNYFQRTVLVITLAILILIIIYPPFVQYRGEGIMKNSGYSFILSPPLIKHGGSEFRLPTTYSAAMVNTTLLLVEYLFVITVGSILFFLFKTNKK
jgi:hypothetical protein